MRPVFEIPIRVVIVQLRASTRRLLCVIQGKGNGVRTWWKRGGQGSKVFRASGSQILERVFKGQGKCEPEEVAEMRTHYILPPGVASLRAVKTTTKGVEMSVGDDSTWRSGGRGVPMRSYIAEDFAQSAWKRGWRGAIRVGASSGTAPNG
ncbi:hypothetical protein CC1G_07159 [Coprinopsis cinerea okayama7|uniref:Uncharacterized protein n=1 Tax=Coprinopsis cinerea (strain Okayama-7 / 130 / ATCC MYA-4618 / FGSC 9003) TaxID=240176 RepID=A8NRA4_COPC7|nr:hypothetical protein CC1G_07159 [Coprinopsis cinerea okayama7\|eukprot:XP_001835735.2 hypothetical protein CC1G_07159 [Coprinopsis cinerea okayama7\